ncbi:hypothetical protein [Polymorphobacter sp.]|uniref:hypothetical protein n=1 Tax=Polymorphobacter sp. TaxID=1909290 RepID=UPI003F7081F5
MRTVFLVQGLLALGLLAGCGRSEAVSLGRTGGAPPRLILTSSVVAINGAVLGEATLYEEVQGDRLVMKVTGLPEGRHEIHVHDVAECSGVAFADAGPERADKLPMLEVAADGAGSLYADLPLPRLRDPQAPRLDNDGMAMTIVVDGQPLGCVPFTMTAKTPGAIDGD